MTLLPDLEAQLRDAARRTQPAKPSRRAMRAARPRHQLLLAALAVALLLASVAVAAVRLTSGAPAPRTTGLGSPYAGPGHPVPGGTRLLAVRADDPDGGPPWGIRVYRTTRRAACWQVGRVLGDRLGVLGRNGLLGDDGLFHELPVERDQCRALDGAGHLFAYQEALGNDSGLLGPLTCLPRSIDRTGSGVPACRDGRSRIAYYGFLGPLARRATLSTGQSVRVSPAQDGAFLFVARYPDAPRSDGAFTVSATYADGTVRPVQDVPPVESVKNPTDDGSRPPGYVDPLRALPDPRRVRARLHVTRRRVGRNTIYTIRFRAPVSVRRYGVEYSVRVDGPAQGEGRSCERPLRFQGFNTDVDVRTGRLVTVKLTPAIALRWNRGWCPGEYRVTVVLHDRAHPVGSFGFRAP